MWLIHICIPDISLLDKITQIRYCRYGSHLFRMIHFLVVFFFHGTDGQKRKKSLRRKLDSLAKEKSKDKGTPSSFDTHFTTFFSLSLPLCLFLSASLCHDSCTPACEMRGWTAVPAPQAGERQGYKNSFCLLGFDSLYLA